MWKVYKVWLNPTSTTLGKDQSVRAIADEVGVHFCTISRELSRIQQEGSYAPQLAQQLSEERKRTAAKANKRTETTDIIIKDSLFMG